MTTQTTQQMAIFPDLPRDQNLVDQSGNITSPWYLYFQQLTMALQTNYKPEGIVIPSKTATEIGSLGGIDASIGNIIYDSTNNVFKGIVLASSPPVVTTTVTFTTS